MRFIIEVDGQADVGNTVNPSQSGQPATPAATADGSGDGARSSAPGALSASGALDAGTAADSGSVADLDVPADLRARAAALNAMSAGRAPDLSALADADQSSTTPLPGTKGAPADAPDSFACGMDSGEFGGITNAGGPAPGLGADAR